MVRKPKIPLPNFLFISSEFGELSVNTIAIEINHGKEKVEILFAAAVVGVGVNVEEV